MFGKVEKGTYKISKENVLRYVS